MATQATAKYLAILLFCSIAFYSSAQDLFINEIMASNGSNIADEAGEFDDWIEIYNASNQAIDLAGMYLSDDETMPLQWAFPTNNAGITTIAANGYLLVWADNDLTQGPLHANFKLSAGGEFIGLFAANGDEIDSFTFGEQMSDISYGREPDGAPDLVFFQNPTPNATNNSGVAETFVAPLVFSLEGGFYTGNQSIEITTTTPDAAIYYSLNGATPTENSALYTGPISVNSTTTIRAKGFKTGILPTEPETHSYLYGINHTFPVVMLSVADEDFFDEETGIYPNHEENWEVPINMELFLTDGTQAFSQVVGGEIHGTSSDSYPQKSIALKAKDDYGDDDIDYPIFPDLPFDNYRSLILRNSGQDWNITHFRDGMVTDVLRNTQDVDDMIKFKNLEMQGFMPTITYINGQYWGIMNLRERMDWRYIKTHFDIDKNDIDLLVNQDEVKEGSIDNWNAVEAFYENNDMTIEVNMDSLRQLIDFDNYVDYCIFRIWNDDLDWPGNNQRRWREQSADGKWRWMTFDVDFSFGLMNEETGAWNTGIFTQNTLNRLNTDNGFSWPNPSWSTALFRSIIQNDNFRTDFINRSADHLNVLYNEDRVINTLDSFQVLFQPEIQGQIDRWQGGFNDWDVDIQKMRTFVENRIPQVYGHYEEEFSDITDIADITLAVSPANAGFLKFSTLTLQNNRLPWNAQYFAGIDIPAEAIAAPGYYFSHWSQTTDNEPIITVNLDGDTDITAHFEQGATGEETIVINEINYNSGTNDAGDWVELHNPNSFAVDISAWYFQDESGEFYGFPPNTEIPANDYFILTEQATDFQNAYPNVNDVYGDFSFKLSNDSELLRLSNAAGVVIDSVRYMDTAPWPAEADGTGLTLQLISPDLANELAQNWVAIEATPGAMNNSNQQGQSIAFSSLSNKFVNDMPFDVSATASSELPVSFSIVSGPASISDNTISLDGIEGIVIVKAEQNGNANYFAATPVEQSFNVTKVTQSIDFQDIPNKYTDDMPFEIFANASSNLAVELSIISGPASISGTIITLDGLVGTVVVRAEQAGDATYLPIELEQSFNVFPPDLEMQSIDFAALADKITTDMPFDISATASSDLPVELSIVSGPASISGNTITLDGIVGTVIVRAEQNGDSNYAMADAIEQSFEVIAAAQSIDFTALEDKLTTDIPFDITATASSNLAVDLSIVSGPATIAGNTITLDGTIGTVTVRAEQNGNTTYEAAPAVEQSFEVLLMDNVEELETAFGATIYPNPVDNQLVISFLNAQNKATKVQVFSVHGQLFLQENINTTQHTLEVANLPQGTYLLRLFAENGQQMTWRFVKM